MNSVRCSLWVLGMLVGGCCGCAEVGAGGGETAWPEEEQSCGGTGEEALEGRAAAGCAWPRGECELAALGTGEAAGRAGTVRLAATETRQLGSAWEAWLASGPAETLALARDPQGGLRALTGCRLGAAMTAALAVTPEAPPAWVATELLAAAPAASASSPCDGATHFVALARGGEGVALPLTCPPLSFAGTPRSCVAAGLDAAAREAWGRALYASAHAAYQSGDYPRALDGFLTLRALMPDSLPAHYDLSQSIARLPEASCAYRDSVERARGQLPDDGSVGRPWPSVRCIPAPPLLGCLSGFVSPPSLDQC